MTRYPPGANFTGNGTSFSLYSEHATQVLLCLFDEDDRERRIPLSPSIGNYWTGYLDDVGPGSRYGYRVNGPYAPESGLLFNPAKLLVDPYAKIIVGRVDWASPIHGFKRFPNSDIQVRDWNDSFGGVPLAVVGTTDFDWGSDAPPATPLEETIIYETHVKGMSQTHPDVPPQQRGTYAGLTHPAIIDHLVRLGATAVELLPVQAFVDDEFLLSQGLRNYWGYSTLGYFALESRYASEPAEGGHIPEFQHMVKTLHTAGIEVLLDVVFNHTAEGNIFGPTLSFRGIDNTTYYRLDDHDKTSYLNDSGTGNSLNIDHPVVLRMVLDSLRYWVTEYHIDGFRFDLATSMGRSRNGFRSGSAFFQAIYQDPILSRIKLIAEPWDLGPHGYQLGHFPRGWSEWNDRFRDSTRSFWLGYPESLGAFAQRFTGSPDLYERSGRGPLASINFVTAHDGFTLFDLVSYSSKHNEANGENGQDGHDHNLSISYGVEGPTSKQSIADLRARQRRNLLATVFLAHGVPMLLGGDELSRTQRGNNNAYCQDNPISWFNWDLDNAARSFLEFVHRLAAIRKQYGVLRPMWFSAAESLNSSLVNQIRWYDINGEEMRASEWERQTPRCLQFVIANGSNGFNSDRLLLIVNADADVQKIQIAPTGLVLDGSWTVELDTTSETGESSRELAPRSTEVIEPRSLLLASMRRTDVMDESLAGSEHIRLG